VTFKRSPTHVVRPDRVSSRPTTKLDDMNYQTTLKRAIAHLRAGGRLTNTTLRAAAEVTYDQAIYFFARAVAEGVLERHGKSSGTHYVAANDEK
jgi:hypothetical protein